MTYKSDANIGNLKDQLRGALGRLLACARRVDSQAGYVEAAGGPKAPSCEEMLKVFIKAEFKHARPFELAEQGIGTRRTFL